MSLQTLSEWLRCPNCFRDLSPLDPLTLRCPNGHTFDVNRRGYVNLTSGSHRLISDSAAMLDARERFLGGGWYRPLHDAVAEATASRSPARVMEVGCGTGYYLEGVLASSPEARCLGMDLSPAAVTRTARRSPSIDGLVADVWSPLPVRTGAADAILVVFAPRNVPEFHRVLRADGLLVAVIPQERHLHELRDAGLMIDVQPGKSTHLIDALKGHFVLESRDSIDYPMQLEPGDIAALVGMGPSAHHTDAAPRSDAQPASPEPAYGAVAERPVTAAFELLRFSRVPVPPGSGSPTPA